jgi:hypothetical protein
MATYKYTGDETKVYVEIADGDHTLEAVPGESYELDTAPDDKFVLTKVAKAAPAADPAE